MNYYNNYFARTIGFENSQNASEKRFLLYFAAASLALSPPVLAQTTAPGVNNTQPQLPAPTFNEIKPIRQSGSFSDFNRGSQQFFQEGREQLYFLPSEESEPILQVDEAIEEQNREVESSEEN